MADTKKILVLFGSPHENGHGRALLDAFLEPFLARGFAVETLSAFSVAAAPCDHCGVCARREGCAKSDLDGFDRSLRACDLLVVESPVYNDFFPAPVKAILDRTQRYFEARFSLGLRPPIQKHRRAALLLTMGRNDDFPETAMARALKRAFTVMNTELSGAVSWRDVDLGDGGKAVAFAAVRALALEILGEM